MAQEKQIYPYYSKVRLKIVSLLADKGGLMQVINCDADIQTEQQEDRIKRPVDRFLPFCMNDNIALLP